MIKDKPVVLLTHDIDILSISENFLEITRSVTNFGLRTSTLKYYHPLTAMLTASPRIPPSHAASQLLESTLKQQVEFQ